jgi:hypothetical protein
MDGCVCVCVCLYIDLSGDVEHAVVFRRSHEIELSERGRDAPLGLGEEEEGAGPEEVVVQAHACDMYVCVPMIINAREKSTVDRC